MKFQPSYILSERDVNIGLKLVIKDGLTSEGMAALTSSTFLTAMALHMGASNLQIGMIAALPTFANIFQWIAIWLLQKYNNRRAVAVICSFLSRVPLVVIGLFPFIFTYGTSVQVLILFLFLHFFFAAILGASWNSWMKDLVPATKLGAYFSNRTRLTQTLNVTLSLTVAICLDTVKVHYPGLLMMAYSLMFLLAGLLGFLGVYLLSRTPEPRSSLANENVFKLITKPLKDPNFRSLVVFNSVWTFALNLATPFFSVYLLKSIHLSLSSIIGLNIVSKLSSILFVRIWGRYSDRYSNKTIIHICAPIYTLCILAWSFTSLPALAFFTLPFLLIIHVLSGIATSGINLAISNLSLKMAPREDAIVYIAARSSFNAILPAVAPLLGGVLADFLAARQLHILCFHHWHFFFLTGGTLAFLSLRFLRKVKEEGEVAKTVVVRQLKKSFRTRLLLNGKPGVPAKFYRFAITSMLSWGKHH